LTASGQKHVELAQDIGLESLEDYLKQNHLDSTQRMAKLLLFLNQVKVVSKDIVACAGVQQTKRFKDYAVLLYLIDILK